MKKAGPAVMGSAKTVGDNRARRAAEEALNSPLLNQQDIYGAEKILLSIISGDDAELQMDELTEITEFIQEQAGDDAEVIFGHGFLGVIQHVGAVHSTNSKYSTNGSESFRNAYNLDGTIVFSFGKRLANDFKVTVTDSHGKCYPNRCYRCSNSNG